MNPKTVIAAICLCFFLIPSGIEAKQKENNPDTTTIEPQCPSFFLQNLEIDEISLIEDPDLGKITVYVHPDLHFLPPQPTIKEYIDIVYAGRKITYMCRDHMTLIIISESLEAFK